MNERLRSAGYLLIGLPLGMAATLVFPLLFGTLLTIVVAGLGLVLLPLALTGLRQWTDVERLRVGRFLGDPIEPRYRPLPRGVGARLRQVVTDPATWRDLGWVATQVVLGIPFGMIALYAVLGAPVAIIEGALWWLAPANDPVMPLGVPVTNWTVAILSTLGQVAISAVLFWWVVPVLARAQAWLARWILQPSATDELVKRVEVLTETRADAIDAHAAELRRIERDLHDGAQAQLVSLGIRLAVAQRTLADDPAAAAELLSDAQASTEAAMAELRQVARTVYPPILTDRGLAGALAALGAGSSVPCQVSVEVLGKLPAAVEAAAYFVVAEGLTNVAKHAHANSVRVRVWQEDAKLLVHIVDDGVGGVDESRGTGVVGIRRRVAALDGTATVSSPAGEGTRIQVELPCGS
ncbi:sensor histidine kinase [Fodinicola acaciae]|uniref:sensor histidine kinase n=1 Tax=Fodinicola acaciae TaxID=2681555 RepID=UPI0013CF5C1D|nr:sensor histidine kinase [Fodinicola acaciae]